MKTNYFENIRFKTNQGINSFRKVYGNINGLSIDKFITELESGDPKYNEALKHLNFIIDKDGKRPDQIPEIIASVKDEFEKHGIKI